MNYFYCSACAFRTFDLSLFLRHCNRIHRHDNNFLIFCSIEGCPYTSKNASAFKKHIKRKHPAVINQIYENRQRQGANDIQLGLNNVQDMGDDVEDMVGVDDENNRPANMFLAAKFALTMETEYKLSRVATDGIIGHTKHYVESAVSDYKSKVENVLEQHGYPNDLLANIPIEKYMEPLENIETQRKRDKFYVNEMEMVHPQGVVLWTERTVSGDKKHIGYYVNLKANLKAFLSMPEVWQSLHAPRATENGIMQDICDGDYVKTHPLFAENPRALQIVLHNDDIEIVNPIGSHTKKHKLSMFYFTIANIPPPLRSNLSAIQLVAIAKAKDLRQNDEALENLLNNFIDTINDLSGGGIELELHGHSYVIQGDLILVPCDSLAASWLGGFKESANFAYRGCRTCDATAGDMKTTFRDTFNHRESNTHRDRCEALNTLSRPSKKYWSKIWGVNKKSCLLQIGNIDLSTILIHDPMHLFMEGVIPYELSMMLFHCIYVKQYFTLRFLNNRIKHFPYSQSDKENRPECIDREFILSGSLKQTAAATLTLCCTLPFMIGNQIPITDEYWTLFLLLVKIMLLVTSPTCTKLSACMLETMINIHHTQFTCLYPKASVTPKMHYMIHLPQQMRLYGPQRSVWCMRFEAKHNQIKSRKWKNFKNLPFSVAVMHQKIMCCKQTGGAGQRNENFLYKGDTVHGHKRVNFVHHYPTLEGDFFQICRNGEHNLNQTDVFEVSRAQIHGHSYAPGCVLLLEYDEFDTPTFGELKWIFVCDDKKYFVVERAQVEAYEEHVISYVISRTDALSIVPYERLHSKWPLSAYSFRDQLCVINRYSHTTVCP